ncbi:hypothetical protein [Paenibacillus eucommiae]|uniref:Uncharacterized protein n=1 Tax=Paenibacillus eucommiae TaxID=1355755 RepID=A0ABS4INE7_9BACL|nr:hypothetical protein [Paenibacillus eucommiae]MBP1988690.1 hypothetical protein [Paenibacillus eucommiae]
MEFIAGGGVGISKEIPLYPGEYGMVTEKVKQITRSSPSFPMTISEWNLFLGTGK